MKYGMSDSVSLIKYQIHGDAIDQLGVKCQSVRILGSTHTFDPCAVVGSVLPHRLKQALHGVILVFD